MEERASKCGEKKAGVKPSPAAMGFLSGLRSPKKSPTNKVHGDAIKQVQIGASKGAVLPADKVGSAAAASKKKNAVVPAGKLVTTNQAPSVPVKSPTVKAAIVKAKSPVKGVVGGSAQLKNRMNKCIEEFTQAQSKVFALTPAMLEENDNKTKPQFVHQRSVLKHLCFGGKGSDSINSTQFERRIAVLKDMNDPKAVSEFVFDYLAALSGNDGASIDLGKCTKALALSSENDASSGNSPLSKDAFAKQLSQDQEIMDKIQLFMNSTFRKQARESNAAKSEWAVAWDAVDRKKEENKKSDWAAAWETAKSEEKDAADGKPVLPKKNTRRLSLRSPKKSKA